MGKIIDRVRDRERRRVSRLITQAEFQRVVRELEAHPINVFWRLVDRLRRRAQRT